MKNKVLLCITLFILLFCFSCQQNNIATDEDGYKVIKPKYMKIGKEVGPPIGWIEYCRRQCCLEDPDPQCNCKYYKCVDEESSND